MTLQEQIKQLHSEGKSYRQIQELLGCSKGTISYHLGAGQKEKSQQRARDKRNSIIKLLQESKTGKICADCKENYPYWMMDFDHLGNKSFNISNFRQHTTSIELVKEEIAKCEIVCANCHRNRTHARLLVTGGDTIDLSEFY